MKKIVAGLMVALGCMSAQAGVLCVVNPTSPVYHVDTYVRMQSSCKTTAHAGKAVMANPFLALAGAIIAGVHIVNIIDWNKDEHKWIDYKVTWADGTTDFVRVRSEEIDIKEGATKLRMVFAESDNPIKSVSWVSDGKPVPTYIIQ
jgi:hypothetical protein